MATVTATPVSTPQSPPRSFPVAAIAVSCLVAALIAGSVGGAFAGLQGFSDGGPLARYGVAAARAIHDAFAAVTIGLLFLAGTILPDTTSTRRRESACRLATWTGTVWVLAGLASLLFLVSNVTGVDVGDPAYAGVLARNVWSFELFRVYLISSLIALGVVVGAATARSKTTMTWMAALSVVAVLPLALAGHSGGSLAHDTAVNALAVHLAAAFVWCGGLAAVLVLRPVLDTVAGLVVRRYSVLAAWCLGGITVSGVLSAAVRLGEWSQVSTTYGLLVVAKVALLAALGAAGLAMRTRVVARLQSDGGDAGAFVRLALGEIVVMAAAMGIGVGLSRSATPVPRSRTVDPDIAVALTGYPAPTGPLTSDGWFTVWRVDWLWLAVALLGIGLYVAAVVRLRRRGDAWPWLRTVPWVFGWVLFIWVTSGSAGVYGRVQFSAHMFMHMMLTMGVPIFLAQGAPLTLAARALPARHDKTMGPREILLATAHSRWLSFWANPVISAINFVGSLYIFYFTNLFELALRTHTGHIAMVVHFLLAGYVFCWSLIGVDPGPRRWPPSLRLVSLFATMSAHAFFGIAIMGSTTVLAEPFFSLLHLPYVPDLLADQQSGGGITWGIGEIPMLYLAMLTALTWMRADEHEAKRLDRQADRDHDAALEAYNAELARRGRQMAAAERHWQDTHRH